MKNKAVSVYPVKELTNDIVEQWENYISLARQYGFNEVFTTLHLPELTLNEQLSSYEVIGSLAAKYEMELISDIGGKFISMLLDDEELLKRFEVAHCDYIRLDYGYSFEQVSDLYSKARVKGFMLNASIYHEEEIDRQIALLKTLEGVKVKFCHNFYPREETGMDKQFALMQDGYIRKYDADLYYYIPSLTCPRGPLHNGLPSIEYHRKRDITYVTLDLINTYHCENVMFADEFVSEDEFRAFDNVVSAGEIPIRVTLNDEVFAPYVIKTHAFRYDSNENILRSASSREMSQFASRVTTYNTVKRHMGDITVDNELYKRYSGEVQVVLKELTEDERVNVVGYVHPDDMDKLSFYRYGYAYRFQLM